MLGKVVGIGAVGLVQLVLTAVAGVGAGGVFDAFDFPTSVAGGAAIWAVVWFLLGYLVYALLFAALGALVSRQEDVAAVTAVPTMMLIILPYVLGRLRPAVRPGQHVGEVLSLFPFFSPTLMPMRIAMDAAPAWQVFLSVVPSPGADRRAGRGSAAGCTATRCCAWAVG